MIINPFEIRRLRAVQGGLATALIALGVAACSIVLNNDVEQCSTNADCRDRGFPYARCDDGTCVNGIEVVPKPDSGADGGTDAPIQSCTKNADCIPGDATSACLNNACVSLTSVNCGVVLGAQELDNDDVVRLGFFTSLSDPATQGYGRALGYAVQAAVDKYRLFSATQSALPPVVAIRCDEDVGLTQSLDHLINVAKVSAIVGPAKEGTLFEMLPTTRASNVPVIAPLANDPRLLQGDNAAAIQAGLLMSVRPNRSIESNYFKTALEKAQELLEAKHPGEFTSLSVSVIVGKDDSSKAFETLLQPKLGTLTPKPQYATYAGAGQEGPLATTVVGQAPNLVVIASEVGTESDIIAAIEAQWTGSFKPYYLVVHKPNALLSDLISGSVKPQGVLGLSAARSAQAQALYAQFSSDYLQLAQTAPPSNVEYAFDAFYVASYGVMGAHRLRDNDPKAVTPIISTDLLQAVQFLFRPPGEAIAETNYAKISEAIGTLNDGTSDVYGASGDLNFDAATGSPPEAGSLFCYDSTAKVYCETGFKFDAVSGAVSGNKNAGCACP